MTGARGASHRIGHHGFRHEARTRGSRRWTLGQARSCFLRWARILLAAFLLPTTWIGGGHAHTVAEAGQPCAAVTPAGPQPQVPAPTRASGSGVTVAVIDTGVAPHPRLIVEHGPDLTGGGTSAFDCDGHGTVVAGIIAAQPGEGLSGIAPGARILAIRQSTAIHGRSPGTAHDGTGTLASLTDAIEIAIDGGARIINISLVACVPPGTAVDDTALRSALDRAETAGAVVVAAAGNDTSDCPAGSTVYPAHMPQVIAVTALSDSLHRADYTLVPPGQAAKVPADPVTNAAPDGPLVTAAPGTVTTALSPTGSGLATGLRTGITTHPFTGTSFAAPVVSGAAALLIAEDPTRSPADVRALIARASQPPHGAFSPAELANLVEATPTMRGETTLASTFPTTHDHPAWTRFNVAAGILGILFWAGATAAGSRFARHHAEPLSPTPGSSSGPRRT